MYRLFFLCLVSTLVYCAPIAAQRGCCDNNYKAGNTALANKNYSEAIRFFTQGSGCGDKCSYDFATLIKRAKNGENAAAKVKVKPKDMPTKPKPEPSTPSVSTPFVAPQMVKVDGGTFQMGDDAYNASKPVHSVAVSDFYIGKYEVTQAEWRSVMGKNPKELTEFKGDNIPVHGVSWYDIKAFLAKINGKTGKNYRLPTEAEWEFAARGGNKSNGYIYSGSNDIESVAWYSKNSSDKMHPVGQKEANELGIYDMSGNSWEWCEDWFKGYLNSDGVPNETGSFRVCRGGSCNNPSKDCHLAYRQGIAPAYTYASFRLAMSSF